MLAGLDVVACEAALRAWIAPQLAEPGDLEPIAIDGKAVRGTRAGPHLPGACLLSVYASRRGAVLAQVAIGSRENELTQAIPVLRQVDLAGKLVTGDALFAAGGAEIRAGAGGRSLCTPAPDLGQANDGRARVHRYRSLDLRLGRELQAFRTRYGLTQDGVARVVATSSAATISQWEAGRKVLPDGLRRERLRELLDGRLWPELRSVLLGSQDFPGSWLPIQGVRFPPRQGPATGKRVLRRGR